MKKILTFVLALDLATLTSLIWLGEAKYIFDIGAKFGKAEAYIDICNEYFESQKKKSDDNTNEEKEN